MAVITILLMRANGWSDRNVILFANKMKENLKLKYTFNHQVVKTVIRSRLDGKRFLSCSCLICRQRQDLTKTRESKFQDPNPTILMGLVVFFFIFFFPLLHKSIQDMCKWSYSLPLPSGFKSVLQLMITDSVWKHRPSWCDSSRGQIRADETKFCQPGAL